MQVGEQSRLKPCSPQGPGPGEQRYFEIAPHLDVPVQQSLEHRVREMSVCVVSKTAPVFLAVDVVLVVGAPIFLVELPECGVINAENLGHSIDLFEGWLAAENHAVVENDGAKIERS